MNKYARHLCEGKIGVWFCAGGRTPEPCYVDFDKDTIELSLPEDTSVLDYELWILRRPTIRCGVTGFMGLINGRWVKLVPASDEVTLARWGATAEEMKFEAMYRVPFVLGADSSVLQRIKLIFIHGIEDDVDLKLVLEK